MPLPQLASFQIAWIVQQVSEYISDLRKMYRDRAAPLSDAQATAMRPFFPNSALTARVLVLKRERIGNPPFYSQLGQFGFGAEDLPNFARMAAITLVDTVVSHEPFSDRLLFHELVHVVQYEKFGLEGFAQKYVKGFLNGGSYEAIPLEKNAYELDGRFASRRQDVFSVEAEVQAWNKAGLF
ncbi:MAG: hypothetical protein JSS69_02015 [Acidobacteria bacterium]|nr:hypothetical protein [Acidobacteriota bacterium]MBS1864669.1 hypothetical protein [Acidobacteriota bacterium]